MRSLIRLFKAVEIESRKKKIPTTKRKKLMERTIKLGFVFSPQVIANYTEIELMGLSNLVEKELGLSAEKMNASFHKSWKKVKDASMLQLFVEQIMHYFTTYGFEDLGIYSEESVYIPQEKLALPSLKDGIRLVVIRGMTKSEIKEKLWEFIQSGIAFKEETLKDTIELSLHVKFEESEVHQIKNRELKVSLYKEFNIVPEDPTEFLRYVIYSLTEKSLLIKNPSTINAIKEGMKTTDANSLFVQYQKKHGLNKLAEIFYRFKPLFLAFKSSAKVNSDIKVSQEVKSVMSPNRQMNAIINKIRRLAEKHHKPMPSSYLNDITAKLKRGEKIDPFELAAELTKVNTFRKIRLAYALSFRMMDVDSIVYKVRNGKSFATDFSFKNQGLAKTALAIVKDAIVADIKLNVEGKKIFIPGNMHYALPATEKQFTGNLPSGSYVTVDKDMVVGIHWENHDGRVDLDLSMINEEAKIGWDSGYRSEDKKILFSGDITDALGPKGASELFFVRRQHVSSYFLFVNFYNFSDGNDVPMKILVAKESPKGIRKNYMVDPNNIQCVASTTINKKQKLLGMLVTTTNGCRFYFSESYLGNDITSSNSPWLTHGLEYLFAVSKSPIFLRDILKKAGAVFVEDREEVDIDLSPEAIDKATIIELLTGGKKNDSKTGEKKTGGRE